MMAKIHRRLHSDEGFTLVELMVVVLIIAILMAIAIPTFLGARQKAQDRAAQSNLRNALTAAKVFYVDGETYLDTDLGTTAAAYQAIEPSLSIGTDAAAADVGLYVANDTSVVLVAVSASGAAFCVADDTTGGGTTYGTDSGGAIANINTLANCADASW